MNIEVLKIEETPELDSKNCVAIAHVRLGGQIILKFKVVRKKDGSGMFLSVPSYKREIPGNETWSQWYMIDSNYLQDQVREAVLNQMFSAQKSAAPTYKATAQNEDDLPF